uniref:Uncharacterized protein n=1 Tax=Triticum urartu TaxID=4572 RepID=A0A8R7QTU7_TRIUA
MPPELDGRGKLRGGFGFGFGPAFLSEPCSFTEAPLLPDKALRFGAAPVTGRARWPCFLPAPSSVPAVGSGGSCETARRIPTSGRLLLTRLADEKLLLVRGCFLPETMPGAATSELLLLSPPSSASCCTSPAAPLSSSAVAGPPPPRPSCAQSAMTSASLRSMRARHTDRSRSSRRRVYASYILPRTPPTAASSS